MVFPEAFGSTLLLRHLPLPPLSWTGRISLIGLAALPPAWVLGVGASVRSGLGATLADGLYIDALLPTPSTHVFLSGLHPLLANSHRQLVFALLLVLPSYVTNLVSLCPSHHRHHASIHPASRRRPGAGHQVPDQDRRRYIYLPLAGSRCLVRIVPDLGFVTMPNKRLFCSERMKATRTNSTSSTSTVSSTDSQASTTSH